MYTTTVVSILSLASVALGHMHLNFPPTLKGDNNPFTQGNADPLLNYPYGCCGKAAPGPCKGHLGLLDTDEGRPVVTWAPGQKANFSLSGNSIANSGDAVKGGTHYGGSCQVGFSTDKGKTFKVATTWQGDCPLRDGTVDPSTQVFDFTVPADLPAGDRVLFAWTWVNREKEFNMNCASVTISGDTQAPQNPTSPQASSAVPKQQPSVTARPRGSQVPSAARPANPQKTVATSSKYTLDGCICACPAQTWSAGCSCYSCESPSVRRRLVERKALEMHKRALQHAEKLNAPLRRAEAVAFNSRPDMLLEIDYAGASCHSQGNPVELQFPDPGPDVVKGDGEYKLGTPEC